MERRDPRGLRDAEGERCPTPDEIEIQRLVAWYFQSSPGSAFDRRRETGDRPEGTGIGR
ncbi:MAG: hypothetical protein ACTHNU_03925 [Gaiellales bacterium]